jgi:hypothetical protein
MPDLLLIFGRCERIRTFDPLHPMQVRYQAAPHTELSQNYTLRPAATDCRRSVGHSKQISNFKQLAAHERELLKSDAHRVIHLRIVKVMKL